MMRHISKLLRSARAIEFQKKPTIVIPPKSEIGRVYFMQDAVSRLGGSKKRGVPKQPSFFSWPR